MTTLDRKPYHPAIVAFRTTIAFAIMGVATAVYVLVCLLLIPWRHLRIRTGNYYGKFVGRTVSTLANIRRDIDYPERVGAQPAIYACNHNSTIDMWMSMWICPVGGCGVAKKEIVRVPFFGQAYKLSGHLLVDRSNRQKAIESLQQVAEVVRKHELSIWMFPEGTRSRDGRLQPFKKGIIHLAIATRLPIIPVVFHDADLYWPGRSFKITPGSVRINILDPVVTTEWQTETADQHATDLWRVFQEQLGPRQQGKEPVARKAS